MKEQSLLLIPHKSSQKIGYLDLKCSLEFGYAATCRNESLVLGVHILLYSTQPTISEQLNVIYYLIAQQKINYIEW
jgi:hypothetical protein